MIDEKVVKGGKGMVGKPPREAGVRVMFCFAQVKLVFMATTVFTRQGLVLGRLFGLVLQSVLVKIPISSYGTIFRNQARDGSQAQLCKGEQCKMGYKQESKKRPLGGERRRGWSLIRQDSALSPARAFQMT